MVSKEVILKNISGLHARPATILVKKASAFKSEITLEFDGKKANVKSLINVLSLGVTSNSKVKFTSSGVDETLALEEICKLVDSLKE